MSPRIEKTMEMIAKAPIAMAAMRKILLSRRELPEVVCCLFLVEIELR